MSLLADPGVQQTETYERNWTFGIVRFISSFSFFFFFFLKRFVRNPIFNLFPKYLLKTFDVIKETLKIEHTKSNFFSESQKSSISTLNCQDYEM